MTLTLEAPSRDLMKVIEVLHGLIRDDEVPSIIPVDVADYRHLADDPRVLLVGHRGLVSVVRGEDGLTVGYRHRRDPLDDDAAHRVLSRVAERLSAALS